MTASLDATPTSGITPATAHPPVAPAGASYVGAITALVLIGLGAIGIRDAAVMLDWIGGRPWTAPVIDAVDGFTPQPWLVAAAAAVAILGLVCVIAAVKPRKKTGRRVTARTSVYLDDGAVARLAGTAVRGVPGVLDARVRTSRSKVVVSARVTTTVPSPVDAITNAVRDALQPLETQPRVNVRTTIGGRS